MCILASMNESSTPATIADRAHLMEAARERLMHTSQEFATAYEILKQYDRTVTFFGSARTPEDNPYYQRARALAKQLALDGFAITTGGGAGIMQAANHGAYDAMKPSIGFNIKLPHEQVLNQYVSQSASFHYFFTRKVMLVFFSSAIIVFPGGFGTIDELAEALTLIQTKKVPRVPVILMGKEYWQHFDDFVRVDMLENHLISKGDEQLYTITDDPEEARRIVLEHADITVAEAVEMPAHSDEEAQRERTGARPN